MYETESLPNGLTHDEVWRIEEAAAPRTERSEEAERVADLLGRATLVGSPGGKSNRPSGPWRRLLWSELWQRLEIEPLAEGHLPSLSSFPFRSWPVSVRPPAEGALDREQYRRLLEVVAEFSASGAETPCVVRYGPCWDMQCPHTFEGSLSDALEHYDDASQRGAPNNVWPEDRSWFIFTDYDLWGTKISGAPGLIAAVQHDTELETYAVRF